jgi:hypothetical protein
MALECLLISACISVPEPYRVIFRSRRESLAVWREGDGCDLTAMALERLLMSACSSVLELYRTIF